MKFNQLQLKKRVGTKRPGRGISAGRGKTAGRGTKGQNSRTGGGTRPGFEGGQNPLYARLPKLPGFRSRRPHVYEVTTGQLEKSFKANDTVDNQSLLKEGLTPDGFESVKIIMGGQMTKSLTVSVQAASQTAKSAIESAGGSFTTVDRPKRPSKKKE